MGVSSQNVLVEMCNATPLNETHFLLPGIYQLPTFFCLFFFLLVGFRLA